MQITDIFSYLPKEEASLNSLEQVSKDYKTGVSNDEYSVRLEIPENASENAQGAANELSGEGKKVAFLLKDGRIVAVIGYKE